ncbi:MAG: hypothetical protein ABSA65_19815 [Acidimicrobiales bacterium]|jgi:hypothetical protein
MIMLGFLALAWGWLEMRSVILRKAGAQAAAKRGTERNAVPFGGVAILTVLPPWSPRSARRWM